MCVDMSVEMCADTCDLRVEDRVEDVHRALIEILRYRLAFSRRVCLEGDLGLVLHLPSTSTLLL